MRFWISVVFLWISGAKSQDHFLWLPDTAVAVGGSGNDGGVTSSELGDGESVTVRGPSTSDGGGERTDRTTSDDPPRHERVDAASHEMRVREWLPTTTSTADDVINRANEVSAPWYDVMLAGLPPAVAYDWRFLVDVSDKLRTAPRVSEDGNDDSRAVFKYLLKRVVETTTPFAPKFDILKHNHRLKTKMQLSNTNDALNWAWKRSQTLN